jgi:gliding motility-associated-like protein
LKYEFIIYNRWGEIVFRTKDLQKGWNGKVNGLDADTYIFVWQCNFQFEGKKAESRKGTVALIR